MINLELWIRSQDRETLMKANRIDVSGTDIICYANDYYCNETYMGNYSSKARALEILDEIEKYIEKQGKTELITEDGIHIQEIYYPNVYKMPKE